jgi:hypothetical protein
LCKAKYFVHEREETVWNLAKTERLSSKIISSFNRTSGLGKIAVSHLLHACYHAVFKSTLAHFSTALSFGRVRKIF